MKTNSIPPEVINQAVREIRAGLRLGEKPEDSKWAVNLWARLEHVDATELYNAAMQVINA